METSKAWLLAKNGVCRNDRTAEETNLVPALAAQIAKYRLRLARHVKSAAAEAAKPRYDAAASRTVATSAG